MRVNTIASPVKWHELSTSFATKCRLTKYVCTRCQQVSRAFLVHYYIHIYIYREREVWGGERERERSQEIGGGA
jgi:hypothetical protein